ncbi:hypothetical protein CEXT_801621 [Caerostris extrusa]|uniref:Uncharacterized protein n=1 Tax=Caerostris extrusa TaxID=172846 RepID=A0AAV4XG11_CAEEX|nr:hypothetical protein CEXT_801621 [Caerostris extrusa]
MGHESTVIERKKRIRFDLLISHFRFPDHVCWRLHLALSRKVFQRPSRDRYIKDGWGQKKKKKNKFGHPRKLQSLHLSTFLSSRRRTVSSNFFFFLDLQGKNGF